MIYVPLTKTYGELVTVEGTYLLMPRFPLLVIKTNAPVNTLLIGENVIMELFNALAGNPEANTVNEFVFGIALKSMLP